MELAHRLRERRERFSLTQERVSRVLGVPQAMISYWETGARQPSLTVLKELAVLYNTTPEYLLGQEDEPEGANPLQRFRNLPENESLRFAVKKWLAFLDVWADFLEEDLSVEPAGLKRPPRTLDEKSTVTDARRASALAEKVRAYYGLGHDALPDLYAFLDEQGVFVYKANLGDVGDGKDSISGAFYSHPKLGYCILVNADTTPGRQAFTLAHEFAHALYHHTEAGIICRFAHQDPLEKFANAFAGNFLVPGKELRRLAKRDSTRSSRAELDPFEALSLARYFGVSYGMILVRLKAEQLITQEEHDAWKQLSASSMAEQLGLDPADFRIPEPKRLVLERYPVSVLERVRNAIEEGFLSPKQAAGLLEVDLLDIQRKLLTPPPEATEPEKREHDQFANV
jgi:Zn-dependent peptidase ImmA (M78 family)/DNA-binding XRE family transcriptional regulator